jgi:predicted nucleotidyltransferase
MIDLVQQHREAILEIAGRRGASDVRVFGSVARGDANEASDIDFLVRFAETASLWDRGGMWSELHELLGRDIDLSDEAPLRDELRDEVLRKARPI